MEHAGDGVIGAVASLIGFLIVAYPLQNIFARAGFARLWAIVLLLGPIGWFVCWTMLAVRRWPRRPEAPEA